MSSPNVFVPIALVGYLLAVGACFSAMPPRRAVLASLMGGWLFLPHIDDRYSLVVFHSKAAFVPAAVLAVSLALDGARWRRLRLRAADLPVALLCLVPAATALQNALGNKEAAAAVFDATMTWGAPYLLGRVYLARPRALKALATAVVAAAIVYAPLCLWEVRMSPQLHQAFYGFRPFGFDQVLRFGGYRPSAFMQHGLALGMFMATGTLVAAWLWRTGARRQLWGMGMGTVAAGLAATTLLCKSTGAILLLALGVAVLEGTRRMRTPILVVALAVVPALYCTARISGWTAETVVSLTRSSLNEERAGSLQFRIDNERLLVERALLRPGLGWGRFGRSFAYQEGYEAPVTVDSLWIITLGVNGLVGLTSLGLMLAIAPLLLLRAYGPGRWSHPAIAPAAVLAVSMLLWAWDGLLNSMVTPLYPLIGGAIVSFLGARRSARHPRRVAPPAAAARAPTLSAEASPRA